MATTRTRTGHDPNRSLLHLLHRAGQAANALLASEITRLGVTPRQLVVLQVVASRPGCRQNEIEAATGIDRSTVADIVQRLIAKGFVDQVVSQADKRARALSLTPDGRKLITRCRAGLANAEERFLAALAPAERDGLGQALRALTGLAGSEGGTAPGEARVRSTD